MTLATFTVRFRFVCWFSQRDSGIIQRTATAFESAASTIPPLGQTVACAGFNHSARKLARAFLNMALNIHVPLPFRSSGKHGSPAGPTIALPRHCFSTAFRRFDPRQKSRGPHLPICSTAGESS